MATSNSNTSSLATASSATPVMPPTPPTLVTRQTDTAKLLRVAQDYKLPQIVRLYVDEMRSDANSVAITSALFAGVLITLAQLIPAGRGIALEALRFFVSCSIVVNLTASALSSCNSWMYSELPRRAVKLVLTDPDSLPYKVAVCGQLISSESMSDRRRLLIKFGISKPFVWAYYCFSWAFLFGNILTVLSVTTWIWTVQSHPVAGASMLFIVPCFASLLYTLFHLLLVN